MLFNGVFANRFRDLSEDIRNVIVEGIRNWCIILPIDFLNDKYMKYMVWALCDKVKHDKIFLDIYIYRVLMSE